MSVVVVAPTYQEAENIERFITGVLNSVPGARVVIVDDASPDGTAALADRLAEKHSDVTVTVRQEKNGLASAYRDGFALALSQGATVVVSMDVDGSHDPRALPSLLARLGVDCDLVIGSRYVPGGGTVNWPLHRRLLSRWGNGYTARLLGLNVKDCTSGYRAYRADALRRLDLDVTKAEGYAFLTELVRRCSQRQLRVAEVPITFVDRQYGTSKMSPRIVFESMILVTAWGVADRWRRVVRRRGPTNGS